MSDITSMPTNDDAPLSMSEGIKALMATETEEAPDEGQADTDEAPEGTEADEELPTDEDGEEDGPTDDEEQAENDEGDDDRGRFVSDSAKVKLPDGTIATIAELKQGTLLHRDYTQKTQAVAEERRQVQSLREQVAQQQQQFQPVREWTEQVLQAYLPQPPDPNLFNTDPMAYLAAKEQYEIATQQLNYLRAQGEAAKQQQQMRMSEEAATRSQQEWAQLTEKLPELKDEQRGKALLSQMFDFGRQNGFTDQEVRSALQFDHRQALVIRKAMQWDKLQANKAKAATKVEGRPPVLQGGKRTTSGQQQVRQTKAAMERLNRTGDVKDAAAAILALEKRR